MAVTRHDPALREGGQRETMVRETRTALVIQTFGSRMVSNYPPRYSDVGFRSDF
jgi:hypothetical protein